jgi:hypothetical protein
MEEELTSTELMDSGIYSQLSDWLSKNKEAVENYRQYAEEVAIMQTSLNNSDENISSYSEYKTWAEEAKQSLKDMGYEEEKVTELFDTLVEESSNPDLSGFKDISDAIEEIKTKVKNTEGLDLESYFTSENYDKAVLASMNWATVTQDNFKDCY